MRLIGCPSGALRKVTGKLIVIVAIKNFKARRKEVSVLEA